MQRLIHSAMTALLLLLAIGGQATAGGGPAPNQWSGSGPFATGLGNRVITALAVSSDNGTVYTGTGSGTVFSYTVTPPTAVSNAATGVTTTTATLNGTVNPLNAPGEARFEYGLTTAYGTVIDATPHDLSGSANTPVSASLTGLTPGATYHFRVVAETTSGTTTGSDQSFIAQLIPPTITSSNSTSFTYGTAATYNITTTGNPPPALTRSGVLPLGVSFTDNGDGTATISGTPNASGSFTITVTATNTQGSDSQSFTLTVNAVGGLLSALDPSISVSPDRHLFGVVELTTCGPTILFTVRNTGTASVTLGTVTKGGTDAGQYSKVSDTCTDQTLAKGASCTIGMQFCPTSVGSKSAQLEIPHDGVTVTAFMYNHESIQEEAARRMPPVLYTLSIPNPMTTTGGPYTITWSLLGYDEEYLSRAVFFDCTGKPAGSCGESFAANFRDSGNLAPVSTASGDWDYNGVTSKRFNYSYSFTPPAGAADIVIRFYRKTAADNSAGKGSLSLLVPGNVLQTGTSYYDADGRRLLHAIAP